MYSSLQLIAPGEREEPFIDILYPFVYYHLSARCQIRREPDKLIKFGFCISIILEEYVNCRPYKHKQNKIL